MKKLAHSLLASMIALAAFAQNNLTVTGHAERLVNADEMIISVGYNGESNNAKQAFENSQNTTRKVLEYLKDKKGVARVETDIVRVDKPNYKMSSISSEQYITIILNDFSLYDQILPEIMGMGFNRIRSVRFSYSKAHEIKQEVQLAAIKVAQQKAATFAKALGVELGEVISFNEEGTNFTPMTTANSMYIDESAAMGPSVAPQQIRVSARVVVSYALKNK